jgi:competence protein ComEA
MHHNTRRGRALALACSTVLVAFALAAAASPGHAANEKSQLTGTVNVNTATADELQLLPGIGASKASALIAMRKRSGGFKSLDELTQVKGIGDAALAKLRPYARVQGKTTARRE